MEVDYKTFRRELLRELKKENALLKVKREDVQWVTKAEFDELKKAFAAKEKELAELKLKI